MKKLKGSCKKCGNCCRFLNLWVPEKLYKSKDVKKWLKYHGIKPLKKWKGLMKLYIPIPCEKLVGNLCSINDRKPKMCKEAPTTREQLVDGCGYHT